MRHKLHSTVWKSLAALLIIAAFTSYSRYARNANTAAALDLFVQIACTGEFFGFKYPMGTGFPVDATTVVTAAHIDCGPHAIMEVSVDGVLWETVKPGSTVTSDLYDIRIIQVNALKFRKYAKLRSPRLGEFVTGYGIAAGNIMTHGIVMKSDAHTVSISNTVAGGMSGSAMVAADGAVIGMVTFAEAARVSGYPTAFFSSGIASDLLRTVIPGLQKVLKDYTPPIDENSQIQHDHTHSQPGNTQPYTIPSMPMVWH